MIADNIDETLVRRRASLLAAARVVLAAAVVVVGYGVFAPPGRGPSIMPWDKAEHFTAFFGLMLLSLVSFPRVTIWLLAVGLSVAGGLIELIQLLPLVGRDGDWKDWAADSLGVLAVVGIVLAAHVRRVLTSSSARKGAAKHRRGD